VIDRASDCAGQKHGLRAARRQEDGAAAAHDRWWSRDGMGIVAMLGGGLALTVATTPGNQV
jgi:hypothetical protein